MPITHYIDSSDGIIYAEVEGVFTTEEMLETLDSTLADENFKPGFQLLSDHRKLQAAATVEQINAMVDYVKAHREQFQFSRWAFVVSRPASFGMMRMLSVYLEPLAIEAHVFTDIDEAKQWLTGKKSAAG